MWNREVDDNYCLREVVFKLSVMIQTKKFNKPRPNEYTRVCTNTNRCTDPLQGLAVICDWAHAGFYGSVSHSPILLGETVCEHTASTHGKSSTEGVCVCLPLSVVGLREEYWKKTWEKTGREIKAEWQQRRRRERHRQEDILPFSFSLSRLHMVVRAMTTERRSQSLAS